MNKKVVIFMVLMLFLSLLPAGQTTHAMESTADNEGGETPSGIPFPEIEQVVDEYMDQYVGKSSPGAAVVLVKDGKILFSKGYGYADLEKKKKVSPTDTVFEYGSISKLFVYTTIMKLVEEGKLDLEADVTQYLPENFLDLRYDKPITMLDIMNHTAGFEENLFDTLLTSPDNLPSLEQALRENQPKQVYEPGTVSAYSNYAIALAGYIAGELSGKEFKDLVTDNIFSPIEMEQTTADSTLTDQPELAKNKALGYLSLQNGDFLSGPWSYVPLYPCGSMNGTAEDLARFAMALLPEEGDAGLFFEKRETLDRMFTQTYAMGPGMTGFAHGFIEWDGAYRTVGHGGNTAAFSAQLNLVPEERFGVIVLTNAAGEMDITSGLTEVLLGKQDKEVNTSVGNLPSEQEVEGTYVSARRMHRGFLKLYGYMTMLQVKAVEENQIELNFAGNKATLVQTKPYVYERVKADGPIMNYNFGTVYFNVADGKTTKMSGDFLPLSTGERVGIIVSVIMLLICTLFYLLTPVVLAIKKWRKRKKHQDVPVNNETVKARRWIRIILLCGGLLHLNNLILAGRMLMNGYRSFTEVQVHIFLNYAIVIITVIFSVLLSRNWRHANLTREQKIFYLLTLVITTAFTCLLIGWGFFTFI